MQGVHPDRVTRGLDRLAAAACGLKHAQLRLQLRRVPAERVEGLAYLVRVVAVTASRQVLEARQRGQ